MYEPPPPQLAQLLSAVLTPLNPANCLVIQLHVRLTALVSPKQTLPLLVNQVSPKLPLFVSAVYTPQRRVVAPARAWQGKKKNTKWC